MDNLYNKLKYVRKFPINGNNWIGNLRWYVKEKHDSECYQFECISARRGESHAVCTAKNMTEQLFEVYAGDTTEGYREYGADYIKTDPLFVSFPFYDYGCIMKGKKLQINVQGDIRSQEETLTVYKDGYYICMRSSGKSSVEQEKMSARMVFTAENGEDEVMLSVSFHTDNQSALEACRDLYENTEDKMQQNQMFWEEYLGSCPLAEPEVATAYGVDKEAFVVRQLWHWWCLLLNVNELDFNELPAYMAPDRTNWKGIWSNDGQLCMAALALTNQKALAKRLILDYLQTSLSEDGILSWYTHSDGQGCYGLQGDVGRFSHGAPYLPQMICYYVKNTGDTKILQEIVGKRSVYEALKKYIETLYTMRINTEYNMVEWANLWETGWDDKGGCFFDNAPLEEWCGVLSSEEEDAIVAFYEKNQRPVIPVVEQVITLWSLYAMADLADLTKDAEYRQWCLDASNEIRNAVSKKCWNEKDGFYHDIDVKRNLLSSSKNADVFYWLYFEKNKKRAEKIYEHLTDSEVFGCQCIPMLSRDSKGFNPYGYWSGGHWPREMSFVAMGLDRCGYHEKARELLVKAIMIAEGCIIPEVVNPLDGKPTTLVTKMAYNIMNIVALLDLEGKVCWCEVD